MSKFIDFSEGKAIMANNADWLLGLNYVGFSAGDRRAFLCQQDAHRRVRQKHVWKKGITFLEFNYMLMQSYDFLHLARGVRLQNAVRRK